MCTNIIRELLGTKIAECNEIQPNIIDDDNESSNIASQKQVDITISKNQVVQILYLVYSLSLSKVVLNSRD